ncbi:MAG: hypothetical protein U0414_36250 [Polyangiaceae bacterium]
MAMTPKKPPTIDPAVLARILSVSNAQAEVDRIHTPTMRRRIDALRARQGGESKDLLSWEGFVDGEAPPADEVAEADAILEKELAANPFRQVPVDEIAAIVASTKASLALVEPGSAEALELIRAAVDQGAALDAFMDAAPVAAPKVVLAPDAQPAAVALDAGPSPASAPVASIETSQSAPATAPRSRRALIVALLLGLSGAIGLAVWLAMRASEPPLPAPQDTAWSAVAPSTARGSSDATAQISVVPPTLSAPASAASAPAATAPRPTFTGSPPQPIPSAPPSAPKPSVTLQPSAAPPSSSTQWIQ